MRILVLRGSNGRPIFYGEAKKGLNDKSDQTGLLAWADKQYSRLEDAIHRSESRIGRGLSWVWHRLERFVGPDEVLLRSLRNQSSIELVRGPGIDEDAAKRLWSHYLIANRRKHTLWTVVDLLISPLTILLAPIPGPNLVGYWFTYRSFCHLLAVLGTRNILDGIQETSFSEESLLELTPAKWTEAQVAAISERFGLERFNDFLKSLSNPLEQQVSPRDTESISQG